MGVEIGNNKTYRIGFPRLDVLSRRKHLFGKRHWRFDGDAVVERIEVGPKVQDLQKFSCQLSRFRVRMLPGVEFQGRHAHHEDWIRSEAAVPGVRQAPEVEDGFCQRVQGFEVGVLGQVFEDRFAREFAGAGADELDFEARGYVDGRDKGVVRFLQLDLVVVWILLQVGLDFAKFEGDALFFLMAELDKVGSSGFLVIHVYFGWRRDAMLGLVDADINV